MECHLRELEQGVLVYASPGALAVHEGSVYINKNSLVSDSMDPKRGYTMEVSRYDGCVSVNINFLPPDFEPIEITNWVVIDMHFLPITPMATLVGYLS